MPLLLQHRFEIIAEKKCILLHPNIRPPANRRADQTVSVMPTVTIEQQAPCDTKEATNLITIQTDPCLLSTPLPPPPPPPPPICVASRVKPLRAPRKKRAPTVTVAHQPENVVVTPLSQLLGSLTDIELLHWYNDVKDCAQRLLEMKAQRLGLQLCELYTLEGIDISE